MRTLSTCSDESPRVQVQNRQFLHGGKRLHKQQRSQSIPLLEPLDKFGSFVKDENITDTKRPKPNRLRIRLVFKNDRLR